MHLGLVERAQDALGQDRLDEEVLLQDPAGSTASNQWRVVPSGSAAARVRGPRSTRDVDGGCGPDVRPSPGVADEHHRGAQSCRRTLRPGRAIRPTSRSRDRARPPRRSNSAWHWRSRGGSARPKPLTDALRIWATSRRQTGSARCSSAPAATTRPKTCAVGAPGRWPARRTGGVDERRAGVCMHRAAGSAVGGRHELTSDVGGWAGGTATWAGGVPGWVVERSGRPASGR